jgi:adenylyltransferase/sulfurtransferase
MALSDTQIDRYSRQIVLPEIGGRGQERLLASAVCLAGRGAVIESAARYLAGAGIGELRLGDGDAALAAALRALNDEIVVRPGDLAGAAAVVAADLDPARWADLAGDAQVAGVPLIAVGQRGDGGWLLRGDGCAVCAALSAAERPGPGIAALAPVVGGALGALTALTALGLALGRPEAGPALVWFDAADASLTPWAVPRRPACPRCVELQ